MTYSQDLRQSLDALAFAHGLELRISHDPSAPMPYAVWAWAPECETEDDADILGAGESESEAVEMARKQIRIWESGGFE
jgi:hypothetical protein